MHNAQETFLERISEYLEKANLPKVPEEHRKKQNDKITMMEITEAIKRQKNEGKKTQAQMDCQQNFTKHFKMY